MTFKEPLVGMELLSKIGKLKNHTKAELIEACGYQDEMIFQEAILDAKTIVSRTPQAICKNLSQVAIVGYQYLVYTFDIKSDAEDQRQSVFLDLQRAVKT